MLILVMLEAVQAKSHSTGKEVVKKNVDSEIAVDELILLLKAHDAWVDPA
jgi:hypothetical protein